MEGDKGETLSKDSKINMRLIASTNCSKNQNKIRKMMKQYVTDT